MERRIKFWLVKHRPLCCSVMESLVAARTLDEAWLKVNPLADEYDEGDHQLISIRCLGGTTINNCVAPEEEE